MNESSTIERSGLARRRLLGGAVAAGVGLIGAAAAGGRAFAASAPATVPTPPPPAFPSPYARFIWVNGSYNTRDFGGYNVGRCGQVVTGRLWRSADFAAADAAGLAELGTLGLGRVADFRSSAELARGLDVLPDGVTNLFVPIGDPNSAGATILSGPPPPGGETAPEPATLAEFRAYITDHEARTSLGTALRTVAHDDRPFVWHCNSGTYRTGWSCAVLLTILGVATSDIYDDFALSDAALGATYTFPDYLDAAFDQINTVYGSFLRYVENGLHVHMADIIRLRRSLLI
jgi:protein-tyrosine phosphatase